MPPRSGAGSASWSRYRPCRRAFSDRRSRLRSRAAPPSPPRRGRRTPCPRRTRPRGARRRAIRTSPPHRPQPESASESSYSCSLGVAPQPRSAGSAECVILQIDLPHGGGERHRALASRAVHKPEQMAGLREVFFVSPYQKNLAVGRGPIELLPQPGEGNHSHTAAQLRLSEDEGEHRDEKIALRHRQHLAGVLRAPAEQHIEHRDGAVLPALRVECEIHATQFHAAHRTSEFRRHPSGHRRQRLGLHLLGRGNIQILHSLRARTAGGGSVRAAGGTSGSDTVNVVPSPTVLLTSISPPCASIIPYDTARPSPTPLPSGLVVKNGLKILVRFSGRMPSPLSETWSRTTPSPLAVDKVTRRSGLLCVASAAFSSRLSTTCWICEGSHGAAGRSSHNVVSTAMLLSFILCSTRESVMRRIRLRSAGARR